MRFISEIAEYPSHFLRNVCRWHNRETGCVPSTIGRVVLETKAVGGLNWIYKRDGRDLILRVCERVWGKQFEPLHGVDDRTEMIVFLLLWAMFASADTKHRGSGVAPRVQRLLKKFRKDRDNLLTDWYCPPPPRGKKCVAEGGSAQ
jgi:hypothetical protein